MSGRSACEIDGAGSGQDFASAEMVIEEKAKTDEPCWSLRAMVWQHEAQWPNDMRRGPQQDFALTERFTDEAKCIVLEIAQPAVNELGRGR